MHMLQLCRHGKTDYCSFYQAAVLLPWCMAEVFSNIILNPKFIKLHLG